MAISCRICFILFAHNYTVNPCFNSPSDTVSGFSGQSTYMVVPSQQFIGERKSLSRPHPTLFDQPCIGSNPQRWIPFVVMRS